MRISVRQYIQNTWFLAAGAVAATVVGSCFLVASWRASYREKHWPQTVATLSASGTQWTDSRTRKATGYSFRVNYAIEGRHYDREEYFEQLPPQVQLSCTMTPVTLSRAAPVMH
jgi:hypothetical protein